MARSYCKSPIVTNPHRSNREGKKEVNKLFRSKNRQLLKNCKDYDNLSFYKIDEVKNMWDVMKTSWVVDTLKQCIDLQEISDNNGWHYYYDNRHYDWLDCFRCYRRHKTYIDFYYSQFRR